MDKNEEALMDSFGISSSQKTYYYYKDFRYENLKDAINYVEIEREQQAKRENAGNR